MKYRITSHLIMWIVVIVSYILTMAFILCSCSSTKNKSVSRTRTLSETRTNSTTTISNAKDSVNVKKDNTVTVVTGDSTYSRETVIEYDTITIAYRPPIKTSDTSLMSDTWTVTSDYFPYQPIRKVTIKESGRKLSTDTRNTATIDSTHLKTNNNTTSSYSYWGYSKVEAFSKVKEVERNNYTGIIIGAVLSLAGGWYFIYWRRRKQN